MLYEKKIFERIETLRYELERLVLKHGLRSPEVLEMSQHLDEALNQYYRFIINNRLEN